MKPATSNQQPATEIEISVFEYLKQIIVWRLSPKKYKGKKYIYLGRKRKVIGETFSSVYFENLSRPVPKSYIKTISKPNP